MRRLAAGLVAALTLAGSARAQEALGEWHGTLTLGVAQLRLGLSVKTGPDGALAGDLTSPDQSPAPVPLDRVGVKDGVLSFESARLRARFEGRWDPGQGAWVGQFTQGAAVPLVLAKGPVPPRLRPQTPRAPFPYREEAVVFDGAPAYDWPARSPCRRAPGRFRRW